MELLWCSFCSAFSSASAVPVVACRGHWLPVLGIQVVWALLGGPIVDVLPYCPAAFSALSSIGGLRPSSSLAGAVSSDFQMGCWWCLFFWDGV